jgi:hypothetical protein
MNKLLSVIFCLMVILLAACKAETPSPTQIPVPTETPIPANPDVINWHLQFSADTQIQLFRCSALADIDSGTVTLMNPISVQLSVVPITPQILEESHRILLQANTDASNTLADLLENPTMFIVLIRLDFLSEHGLYEPYRMLRTSANGSTLNSLSEIRFELNNEAFTDDAVTLQIHDRVYKPTQLPDSELEAGVIYPIYFMLDSEGFETMLSSQAMLSVDVGMLVPFRLETCQAGNYQQFNFQPRIISGAAHELPDLYGNPGNQISSETVDAFRLALLSNILPNLAQVITEFEIEVTVEATESVEMTPEATESSTQD